MRTLIALLFLLISAGSFAEGRCQGGDGPVPFSEVAGPDQSSISIFATTESVDRFEVWEKSKKIVYQSPSGAIFEHSLATGADRMLGASSAPIERSTDPEERFVLLSGIGKILDAFDLSHVLSAPGSKGNPAFWNRSALFSIQSLSSSQKGIQELHYSVFDTRSASESNYVCKLAVPPGADYQLGRGHQFPAAFLYRALSVQDGTRLSLYHVNLSPHGSSGRCKFVELGEYSDVIKGRVQQVIEFGNQGHYLTRTDHPESSILFDSPKGCGYFNVGRQKLLIPSYREPLFFTYGRARGLEMYQPEERQVVSILKGAIQYPVREDQIWMGANGKDLWLSLRTNQAPRGYLFRTQVDAASN